MPKLPYAKRHHYPHLLQSDITLWERFIEANPNAFDAVEYDVHVGEGIPPDPTWEPEIAEMARILTQKRIDVVAYKGQETYIIEIKPRAGTTAIGQVITYAHLYTREYHPPRPPKKVIITDYLAPDIAPICDAEGITVLIA